MWLFDEWQPQNTLDKMEGERKRKRGRQTERKAEKWRVVEGEKAGLCNRWSWRILTTGEYARLPQSDKWLSRSQTTGPNRKKTIFICSQTVLGETFVLCEKSTVIMEITVKKHQEDCPYTKKDWVREKEAQHKDKYTGPVDKSCHVSIGIYFGLSSFNLVVWIIHWAGACRNYSTTVDETKLQGCMAGEPQS